MDQVLAILNRIDPMRLFAAGSPADEYKDEAAMIAMFGPSINASRVLVVFEGMFWPGCITTATAQRIASEVAHPLNH